MSEETKRLVRLAAQILREEGAREVYLFGSLAKGKERPDSDIDLAVSGLPPERFIKAMAKAMGAIGQEFDLVDLDEDSAVTRCLREHGGLQLVA
jgi:predicted nucleotidyltransferase